MKADRLSSADISSLAFEGSDTPMHVMALLWLEPAPLLGADGQIALEAIRHRVEVRLADTPRLRQVVVVRGYVRGACWRDATVDIARHVRVGSLPSPGTEEQLLDLAAWSFMERLERDRPLWELRLVTGLADGRVVAMFKLHHAIADGPAAVRLLASLFDVPAEMPIPTSSAHGPSQTGSPLGAVLDAARRVRSSLAYLQLAPRTSLNRPVGRGRRIALVRLDLADAKQVAHAHGAKVNDILLTLAARGARAILDGRGETVAGGELKASAFVALRRDRAELGNATGVMGIRLPVSESDPVRALERIASATAVAKRHQPAAGMAAVSFLVTRAGLGRALYRRQRQVNVFTTNVVGPTAPAHVLGTRVDDVAVITPLGGNVALSFAALSYAGRLNVTVIGDATTCPEVGVAADAMRAAWGELRLSEARR